MVGIGHSGSDDTTPSAREPSRSHEAEIDLRGHEQRKQIEITAHVIISYASTNSFPAADLPELIAKIHAQVVNLTTAVDEPIDPGERKTPVQIKKSITRAALISFVDGKRYKTLKRHLSTHGLTFEGYRERYGLPADYPMVAADYSNKRSEMALERGLGRSRSKPPSAQSSS